MFYTDYEKDTMPFTMEGEHTSVLGEGEVIGKIVVAQTPIDIIRHPAFHETGVTPVLLDEYAVTDEKHGNFDEVARMLQTSLWAGFVTFGSSEMIESRRRPKSLHGNTQRSS